MFSLNRRDETVSLTCYQNIFDQIQIRNINGKLNKYWKIVVTNTSSNRSLTPLLCSVLGGSSSTWPDTTMRILDCILVWTTYLESIHWPYYLPKMLCNVSTTLGLLLVATGLLLLFLLIVSFLLASLFTFLKLYLAQTQMKTSSTPPFQIPEKTPVKYK